MITSDHYKPRIMVWGIQVNGLYVECSPDHEAIIFHALFGNQGTSFRFLGDKRYEIKDWVYKNSR